MKRRYFYNPPHLEVIMKDVKRILAVSRLTAHCRNAVDFGTSLSKKYDAMLHVLHAVHNPFELEGWNLLPFERDFGSC